MPVEPVAAILSLGADNGRQRFRVRPTSSSRVCQEGAVILAALRIPEAALNRDPGLWGVKLLKLDPGTDAIESAAVTPHAAQGRDCLNFYQAPGIFSAARSAIAGTMIV